MKSATLIPFLAFGAVLVLAGCETNEPEVVLGESVRTMIEAQTHDPGATAAHSTNLPEGTDPDRASAAVQAMRNGVAKPTEAWSTVIVTGAATSSDN